MLDIDQEDQPRKEEVKAQNAPELPKRDQEAHNDLDDTYSDELKSQILNHIGDNRISQLISFMIDTVRAFI